MDLLLTDTEVRVLGCLLEKEMATPDYYPLSLNALVTACNQKTNRYPVVSYDQDTVSYAINGLKEQKLAYQSQNSRVPKFAQLFSKELNLLPREKAVLCLLFVRGPQTVGELKNRSDRLYKFESLDEVSQTLEALVAGEFVIKLDRKPGHKESRYTHLLSGAPQEEEDDTLPAESQSGKVIVRREKKEPDTTLEAKVERLEMELNTLRAEFELFASQFD